MGTRVKPPVRGTDCLNWLVPDETPGRCYSIFWDVKKGDRTGAQEPKNLHIFSIYQHVTDPCIFSWLPGWGSWASQFGVDGTNSWLYLFRDFAARQYYFSCTQPISPVNEYIQFDNFFQTEINNYGYGGHGTIFWMKKVIDIVEQFGWDHLTDVMLEVFPVDAVSIIHKFCTKTLGANVCIKFDK